MRSSARRLTAAALLCAVAGACALALAWGRPAPARADGDPASDVLLVQDVFYPYRPKVSASLEAALEQSLRALARAGGMHLKVAIIGAPFELGLVPSYFGRPQAYAEFLDKEISFNGPPALLTVMPAGLGVVPAIAALAGVPVDASHGSDGLARTAVRAVVALARHEGHPIPLPSLSGSAPRSGGPGALVFALPVALLALAGLLALRRGRRRPTEGRTEATTGRPGGER